MDWGRSYERDKTMLGEVLLLGFADRFNISILGGTMVDIGCTETAASTRDSEAVVRTKFLLSRTQLKYNTEERIINK